MPNSAPIRFTPDELADLRGGDMASVAVGKVVDPNYSAVAASTIFRLAVELEDARQIIKGIQTASTSIESALCSMPTIDNDMQKLAAKLDAVLAAVETGRDAVGELRSFGGEGNQE